MAEHVNLKCDKLELIKRINDKISTELKQKSHTIGVKVVYKWINNIKKAIADGVGDQIDSNFIDSENVIESQPSSQENVITQKVVEEATNVCPEN